MTQDELDAYLGRHPASAGNGVRKQQVEWNKHPIRLKGSLQIRSSVECPSNFKSD
jgi:hypothetical protein